MNLFVIAQFGQLIHNEALIKRDKLEKNKLIILYTSANILVPEKIKNEVDSRLFSEIEMVEIPLSPNSIDIENINVIFKTYKRILKGVDDLYISSFERHYNILHEVALRKKIRTHLVEEGLGTYKFASNEFSFTPPSRKDSLVRALNKSGLSSNKYFPIIKSIRTWILDTLSLPKQLFKALLEIKNSEFKNYKKLELFSDERNGFLGYAKNFHSINLAYPEAVSNVFESKESKILNTYSSYESNVEITSLITKYDIRESDSLYLSQVFQITSVYYADAVIKIIKDELEKSEGRFFIKFHPKDKIVFIDKIKEKVLELGLSDRIIIISESDFPIEAIIKESKFERIIAISSTALVYAKQLSESTECVSITNTLISRLGSNCPVKTRKLMLEHTEMLSIFPHIEFK
ncbi:polysialyltransferase family glycosyltransferase [Enterovibrio norvegicus]|uniref:Alpha-2,8-polysialyltransferase (POLYST) n=1 Tax=Enterovibrio norvegicus DSM 15893 TaxID=1121869 RepID=A0A1I5S7K8_9GAMM|nr:polysialyltransferase family glycosyltransferase [Enterovibrio norvegicus]SFP66671.1 Alpha-2,8-polysialyltransferase (POLYST) [Enterovibrio norvegicus DSM 15893]